MHGMTGVDLSLPIAGPGSRAFAFVIDWHIRLLLALAWLVVAMIVTTGGLQLPQFDGPWAATLFAGPPILIYLLYHPVVELLMRGQTPGKRMAQVRVVNREGGTPGMGAILVRNAFRLIDSMPSLYVVGLVCTFVNRQRLRIGDMAAGTLLVTTDTEARQSLDRVASGTVTSGLDPAALDVVDQVLERWKQMEPERRAHIARALLQRIDAGQYSITDMTESDLHDRLVALSGRQPA